MSDDFSQFELPDVQPEGLNIVPIGSDSVVSRGSLKSPNYVKGLSGWSINSDGTAEFMAVSIAGILVATQGTFGGDGSDGSLSISSGTTTIDLGNAAVVIKNYTSVSITGTGKLAFSNPHANGTIIILKSQGDVTITSSTNPAIDVRALGAARKTGSLQAGEDGNGIFYNTNNGNAGVSAGGIGGVGLNYSTISGFGGIIKVFSGASGGSGLNSDTTTYGYGGAGGGGLYIECADSLDGSSTLNASGEAGGNGQGSIGNGTRYGGGGGGSNTSGATGGSGTATDGSGGGGGGGGVIIILYTTLTSNTMTLTVSGGAGGSSSMPGGAGGNGFSVVAKNISNG